MSNGVEFEEDKFGMSQKMEQYSTSGGRISSSKMGAWLVKKGIVKSETGAQAVLLAVVVINIIVTILVIKYFL